MNPIAGHKGSRSQQDDADRKDAVKRSVARKVGDQSREEAD
jgi:hypothetical protein